MIGDSPKTDAARTAIVVVGQCLSGWAVKGPGRIAWQLREPMVRQSVTTETRRDPIARRIDH